MLTPQRILQLSQIPTPFYYYDMDVLRTTLSSATYEAGKRGYILHYALKANSNPKILSLISKEGLGVDCVSGNEILRAVSCGFSGQHVTFAGVGKSDAEIAIALDQQIFCFNCESVEEIEVINQMAAARNVMAPIAIRVNPNVDAHSHRYITTGLEENKFGISSWEFDTITDKIKQLSNVKLISLHFHIGSQIIDMDVFRSLCIRVNEYNKWFADQQFTIQHINVGGGLGIDYHHPDILPDFAYYFGLFEQFLKLFPHQELHFEPGRALVAQAGTLISKVLFVKKGRNTNFAILDAGMTDLIRPALYQAYHKIENITSQQPPLLYDVVGPICESSDCFGKAVELPTTKRGDLVAIRSAGAYGEVMVSQYNLRDLPKAYYSDEL